jgi:hypothetical protein
VFDALPVLGSDDVVAKTCTSSRLGYSSSSERLLSGHFEQVSLCLVVAVEVRLVVKA